MHTYTHVCRWVNYSAFLRHEVPFLEFHRCVEIYDRTRSPALPVWFSLPPSLFILSISLSISQSLSLDFSPSLSRSVSLPRLSFHCFSLSLSDSPFVLTHFLSLSFSHIHSLLTTSLALSLCRSFSLH